MKIYDPGRASKAALALFGRAEDRGLKFIETRSRLSTGDEEVSDFMAVTHTDAPAGRVGAGVGWTTQLPNGRHVAAERELVVAVPPDLQDSDRDRLREELRSWVEAEVAADLDALQQLELEAEVRLLTERSFYEAVLADIREAEHSVLILAPYLGYRIKALVQPLIDAAQRGADVVVVIRPEQEKPWVQQFLDPMRSGGVTVVARTDNMHEKIVTIDHDIVYHGSLNPLSHKDTTESMLRLRSRTLTTSMNLLYHPDSGQAFAERVEMRIDDGRRAETRWTYGGSAH